MFPPEPTPSAEGRASSPDPHLDALREENRDLRRLIDLLPQMIYVKDRDSRMLIANRAQAHAVTGDPEADLSGKTDSDYYDPHLAEKFRRDEESVMRSGQPIINQVEEGRDFRTGELRWVMTTKVPVFNDNGEVSGLIGIGTDITTQKRQDEQFRLQAAALDAAGNSILITEADGNIVWVNRAFLANSGYTETEAIGKKPQVLRPELHTPEFHAEIWKTLRRGNIWSGTLVSQHRNGTSVTEQTTISPVRDAQGEITHFVTIMKDISHEKALERENLQIHAAIENAEDAIVLADRNGRITYVNQSFFRLFRTRAAGIVSRPLSDLFSRADAVIPQAAQPLDQLLQHGWEEHLEIDDGNGRSLSVRARVSQIRGKNETQLGFACYLYDLSDEQRRAEERRLMEVRLRQAQKLESIGQLAAGVAHEINTPTQFVGDNIHFLGESVKELLSLAEKAEAALAEVSTEDGPWINLRESLEAADLEYLREEIPASLAQATEGVQRIAEIVKAMKEFSHPGTKDRKLANLNDALTKAATVARNEWKYHAEVEFDLDPDLAPVLCLPGEINQVFLNIIVNAAHAVKDVVEAKQRERGLIRIATRQSEDGVEIRVTDNGTGIPPDVVDRIFDPFFTTKEVGKGTGQGLAIAYDTVVTKHQGKLYCETAPGGGTTFVIRLPQGKVH